MFNWLFIDLTVRKFSEHIFSHLLKPEYSINKSIRYALLLIYILHFMPKFSNRNFPLEEYTIILL